jgi:hypothetical protein
MEQVHAEEPYQEQWYINSKGEAYKTQNKVLLQSMRISDGKIYILTSMDYRGQSKLVRKTQLEYQGG